MKKITFLSIVMFLLLCSSCQTINNWLFDASDYHLFESKKVAKEQEQQPEQDQIEQSIFWDDSDFDIWYDENEYD